MTNRDEALRDLAAIAPVVAGETVWPAARARLLMPWVERARLLGLGWRDLTPSLGPLFCGALEDRPALEHQKRRIAASVGVPIPGAMEAPAATPLLDARSINNLVQAAADMAATLAAIAKRDAANEP